MMTVMTVCLPDLECLLLLLLIFHLCWSLLQTYTHIYIRCDHCALERLPCAYHAIVVFGVCTYSFSFSVVSVHEINEEGLRQTLRYIQQHHGTQLIVHTRTHNRFDKTLFLNGVECVRRAIAAAAMKCRLSMKKSKKEKENDKGENINELHSWEGVQYSFYVQYVNVCSKMSSIYKRCDWMYGKMQAIWFDFIQFNVCFYACQRTVKRSQQMYSSVRCSCSLIPSEDSQYGLIWCDRHFVLSWTLGLSWAADN